MSRGLGIMQRRILDALVARPGGDRVDERHVASFGLAPGVHDLRKVSRALASEYAAMSCANYATGKWQASFSRAVAGLVARGYLKVPSLVPITDVGEHCDAPLRREVHYLSDGEYVDQPRQRRFVSVMSNDITLKSDTAAQGS